MFVRTQYIEVTWKVSQAKYISKVSIAGPLWLESTRQRAGNVESEHYSDDIMGTMASQITSLTIVYSTVYSGPDQRKHRSSASLAFVRGIHRWPVNSPYKWPVTRKMFPFDDVIMNPCHSCRTQQCTSWIWETGGPPVIFVYVELLVTTTGT